MIKQCIRIRIVYYLLPDHNTFLDCNDTTSRSHAQLINATDVTDAIAATDVTQWTQLTERNGTERQATAPFTLHRL